MSTESRPPQNGPWPVGVNEAVGQLFGMVSAVKALPFWPRLTSVKPGGKQSPPTTPDRRPCRGDFDVLGHPIMIVGNPDGTESALDYSTSQHLEVPVDWVRAFGREIDVPQFDGLMLARRTRIKWPASGPVAFVGPDGSAMIVTPEGATLTRFAGATPRWRRGLHRTVEELRVMRRAVGELARTVIADFQDSTGGNGDIPMLDDDPVYRDDVGAKAADAIAAATIARAARR